MEPLYCLSAAMEPPKKHLLEVLLRGTQLNSPFRSRNVVQGACLLCACRSWRARARCCHPAPCVGMQSDRRQPECVPRQAGAAAALARRTQRGRRWRVRTVHVLRLGGLEASSSFTCAGYAAAAAARLVRATSPPAPVQRAHVRTASNWVQERRARDVPGPSSPRVRRGAWASSCPARRRQT